MGVGQGERKWFGWLEERNLKSISHFMERLFGKSWVGAICRGWMSTRSRRNGINSIFLPCYQCAHVSLFRMYIIKYVKVKIIYSFAIIFFTHSLGNPPLDPDAMLSPFILVLSLAPTLFTHHSPTLFWNIYRNDDN